MLGGLTLMFNVRVYHISNSDTILCSVDDDIDLSTASNLQKYLNELFPNNKVSIINDTWIKGFTIIKNGGEDDGNPFLESLKHDFDSQEICF